MSDDAGVLIFTSSMSPITLIKKKLIYRKECI